MRVLLVHNRYRTSAPSGEDAAVRNEKRMLESRGNEVELFDRCNDDIDVSTFLAKTATAARTIWSQRARSAMRNVLRKTRPDVVHVHNTFSMISPSVYGICKEAGVPVVQTLHNFRMICPQAMLLRHGKPCEACLDRSLLQSIRHRCYRGSFAATATLASMLTLHRALGTYAQFIDRYIALTHFAQSKMLKAGLEPQKIVVKPNFIPDPPLPGEGGGGYVIFAGRLLEGKGTETLLSAWSRLPDLCLKIVGDGALRPKLETIARLKGLNVQFLGMQSRAVVLRMIADAKLLVIPSEWYEGFPMVVAEAFACGTPVLASRIGSLDELVQHGVNGLKFTAGDSEALAAVARQAVADEPGLQRMRAGARNHFETFLTEEQNYRQLLSIYTGVLTQDHGSVAQSHG